MQGTMGKTKEEKEREAPADRRELALLRIRTCALSNLALEPDTPVVVDELGSLFSKVKAMSSIFILFLRFLFLL